MSNTIIFETQRANGTWREWKNVAIPVKYGLLLDEQLDFATISLVRIKKKEFKPLTRARLTITSSTAYTEPQSSVIEYFIANDEFYEAPVGSGAYNHELTLIELTKLLECFPLETLCFTNPNGNNYTRGATHPFFDDVKEQGTSTGNVDDHVRIEKDVEYFTPSAIGQKYRLCNAWFAKRITVFSSYAQVTITHNNKTIKTIRKTLSDSTDDGLYEFYNEEFEVKEGETTVKYEIFAQYGVGGINEPWYKLTRTFIIYGVQNRYPLKPWTIDDVIQRILQVVEPIRKNQDPRFTFTSPSGAKAKLFSQFAPEFTLTRQTLREALQTVGGFIHAEPRLNVDNENNFYITFDYYGEQEYAEYKNYKTGNVKRLSKYKYRTLQSKYGIEQASTKIDSYQDNLVNRVAWEEATIGQPYQGGQQTLRTETAYIRGEEQDSFFFPTTHSIDRVVKFEYNYNGTYYDLTPYIFEKSVYDYLSSYDTNYPSSKSYALYYTNGSKGIKGFFYKVPSKYGGGVGEQYSIVNIIERVCGITLSNEDYAGAIFRLTYVPIYNTRVQQSKAYINEYLPLPRILNHTQSDNSVETRYFGEHIKGAISRMGNVEKTYTINLRNLDNIPKAGQLWDDDYYIANVSVSVNADLFEVSVGLSKNFNRKSQYLGASSYKRIYEVSETMVQERHTVYTDYFVIRDDAPDNFTQSNTLLRESGLRAIAGIFDNKTNETTDKSVVAVFAYGAGKTIEKTIQEKVLLPVISSAFGNAMEFTWEYKDNFSAGIQQSEVKDLGENISGRFGKEVPYADYYGRLYYYYFSLLSQEQTQLYNTENMAYDLPMAYGDKVTGMAGASMGIDEPFIERKDGRETLKKSYVIEFVTDNNNFVIGSALASLNPLVSAVEKRRPHLYILPYRVNKFANAVDLSAKGVVDMGVVDPNIRVYPYLSFGRSEVNATAEGKSWVYAMPTYTENAGTVEDEDGATQPLIIEKGGEVLLAKNGNFKANDPIGAFRAILTHDVYDYLKQIKN